MKFGKLGQPKEDADEGKISASTQSKAVESERISETEGEISAEISAGTKDTSAGIGKKSTQKSGISAQLILGKIAALEARLAALEGHQAPDLALFETFLDKYAGSKKRWQKPNCQEADFLTYKKLKAICQQRGGS